MADKDYVPYSSRRWHEIPAVRVVGHSELTPEEKAAAHETLMKLIEKSEEVHAKIKAGIPVDDNSVWNEDDGL